METPSAGAAHMLCFPQLYFLNTGVKCNAAGIKMPEMVNGVSSR